MPVSKDPIDLGRKARPGRDLDKTVSEQALDFELDLKGLKAHLLDPVDAHDAAAISVEDTAGNFTSDNVEGALAEVGGTAAAKFSQGVIEDCSTSTAGLDVTLAAGSKVFIHGTVLDVGGQSVTVDNNQTRYLYIDATDDTLKQAASAGNFASGNVVLWEVTTLAGSVDSVRDLRYFVFGSDRKDTIQVIDGVPSPPDFNERSEGHFMSIQAALDYIDVYGASSEERRRTIVVRGAHQISEKITIPVSNVTIKGDGRGNVLLTAGNNIDIFDLNGQDNITFDGLGLQCNNHSGCNGIVDSVNNSDNIIITGCTFAANTQAFDRAIHLDQNGAATTHLRIYNCQIGDVVDVGIYVRRPDQVVIRDCDIDTSTSAAIGISLGTSAEAVHVGEGASIIERCRVEHFDVGIFIQAESCIVSNCIVDGFGNPTGVEVSSSSNGCRVIGTTIRDCDDGIQTDGTTDNFLVSGCELVDMGRGIYIQGGNTRIVNTTINGRSADGITGIRLDGAGTQISGCTFVCTKSSWTSEDPIGLDVRNQNVSITDCHFGGWYNTNTPAGSAVRLRPAAASFVANESHFIGNYKDIVVPISSGIDKVVINGCQFENAEASAIEIQGCNEIQVTGCHFKGGNSEASSAYVWLNELTSTSVTNNHMECGTNGTGIYVEGSDSSSARTITLNISGNTIDQPGDYGIHLTQYVRAFNITGNNIDGWAGASTDVTAGGIYIHDSAGGFGNKTASISGNTISRCTYGIQVEGTPGQNFENLSVTGNTIRNCAVATTLSSEDYDQRGSAGIIITNATGGVVSSNSIYDIGQLINNTGANFQPSGTDVGAYGIFIHNCNRMNINGNQISQLIIKGSGEADGIRVEMLNDSSGTTTKGWHRITGNTLTNVDDVGIAVKVGPGTDSPGAFTLKQLSITNNTMDNIRSFGIRVNVEGDVTNNCTIRNLRVNGNQIDDASAASIRIDTTDYGGLWNVQVNGNQITQDGAGSLNGIEFESDSANATQMSDIQVNDNQFYGNNQSGDAINIATHTVDVDNITINGNSCNEWDAFAVIQIGTDAGATSAILSNVNIVGNTIIDADSQSIFLQGRDTIQGANISQNFSKALSTNQAAHVQITTFDGSVERLGIKGNRFYNAGVNIINIFCDDIGDSQINDNHFEDEDGTNVNGINLSSVNGGTTPHVRGLRIQNNSFNLLGGYGIYIDDSSASSGTMSDILISGNSFDTVATDHDSWSAIRIHADHLALRGVSITGNRFDNCNNGDSPNGVIRLDSDVSGTDLVDINISGNTIDGCNGSGIQIIWDDPGSSTAFNNIRVCDNHIESDHGIEMVVGGSSTGVSNGHINNNTITGPATGSYDGIHLDFSATDDVDHLQINGNHVFDTPQHGIYVIPATTTTAINRAISICDNMVVECTNNGIFFDAENISVDFSVRSLRINNNDVSLNNDSGIVIKHSTDGDTVNSQFRGQFNNNSCYGNNDYGMHLILRGETEACQVIGNLFEVNADGFRLYIGIVDEDEEGGAQVGANAGVVVGGVQIIGNISRDNSSSEVDMDGGNWPPTDGICVSNIDGASGGDQWIDHDGGVTWRTASSISIT